MKNDLLHQSPFVLTDLSPVKINDSNFKAFHCTSLEFQSAVFTNCAVTVNVSSANESN